MITNASIVSAIERHCREHNVAETTFGKRAVNDGKLLSRLRSGKSISIDTYNRIMAAIAEAETDLSRSQREGRAALKAEHGQVTP